MLNISLSLHKCFAYVQKHACQESKGGHCNPKRIDFCSFHDVSQGLAHFLNLLLNFALQFTSGLRAIFWRESLAKPLVSG